MISTLPFGSDPNAPPTSPLATPANAAVGTPSPFVPSNQQGLIEMLTRIANSGVAPDASDRGAGFTGTGLRGPGIADVTRDDQNLGPQAGVMKSAQDVAAVVNELAGVARGAMAGLPGLGLALARSTPVRGLVSNVLNYSDIADKTAAYGARGGPAQGGMKGNDRPGPAGPSAVEGMMANGIAVSDVSGPGMNDAMGAGTAATGGAAPGTDDANSNSTAAGQDAAGPGAGNNFARGGLIELVGGGKVARGPGGGMDDLIPTTIDGQRAAALSDGEFVVPADVVSMMGDGSSNAGSKRLYDLVREIRESKTGTGQQANPLQFTDILRRTLG